MAKSPGIDADASFDFVIVGGGTAGCLLANRLSADPDVSVLLIEAGGSDRRFWINVPVGYLYNMGNPAVDWCYRTESDPGLNGRSLAYPRGKVLGGCSSINGMIYMPGSAESRLASRQPAVPPPTMTKSKLASASMPGLFAIYGALLHDERRG